MSLSHPLRFAVLLTLMVGSSAIADELRFDVTFNDVTIDTPPGYADLPTTTVVPGGVTSLPTSSGEDTDAVINIYEQFVDSVTANTLGGGGDHVAIYSDTTTGGNAYMDFQLAPVDRITAGQAAVNFQVIFDSSGDDPGVTTNNEVFFAFNNAQGNSLATFKFRQQTGRVTATAYDIDGNSVGTGSLSGNGEFSLGQVLDIRIEMNFDTDRASLFIDDQLVALNGALSDGTYSLDLADGAGIELMRIITPTTSTARMGVDNVTVTIPEPSALGLFGWIGSMLLLARRRH